MSKKNLYKLQKGGIKELVGENRNNLLYVWDSLFYKKFNDGGNPDKIIITDTIEIPFVKDKEKRALFVIDMQNDFVDFPYERNDIDKEYFNCFGSTAVAGTKLGNFPVAQGSNLIDEKSPMLNYINRALEDNTCVTVFSRDYHPAGHMSFSDIFAHIPYCREAFSFPRSVGEDNVTRSVEPQQIDGILTKDNVKPLEGSGNFPPHCIQCCAGTKFCPAIEKLLSKSKDSENNHIVFKGIHKGCDSFTAVDKTDDVDSYASNTEITDKKACCSGTGAYYAYKDGNKLSFKESITFLEKLKPDDNYKVNYKELLKDVTTIEVCGLAGDYCVRDTATSLAKMFPDKKVIVLNDFTRYAVLPLHSVDKLPIHNYSNNIDINGLQNPNLELFLKIDNKKDIYNYLIHFDVDTKQYRLIKSEEVSTLSTKDLKDAMGVPELKSNTPTYQHFITPHKDIIADYNKYKNLQVKMGNIVGKGLLLQSHETKVNRIVSQIKKIIHNKCKQVQQNSNNNKEDKSGNDKEEKKEVKSGNGGEDKEVKSGNGGNDKEVKSGNDKEKKVVLVDGHPNCKYRFKDITSAGNEMQDDPLTHYVQALIEKNQSIKKKIYDLQLHERYYSKDNTTINNFILDNLNELKKAIFFLPKKRSLHEIFKTVTESDLITSTSGGKRRRTHKRRTRKSKKRSRRVKSRKMRRTRRKR